MAFFRQLKFNIKYFYFYMLDILGIYVNVQPPVKATFSRLLINGPFETPLPIKMLFDTDGVRMKLSNALTIEPVFYDKDNIPTNVIDGRPIWNCRDVLVADNRNYMLSQADSGRGITFRPEMTGQYRLELLIDSDMGKEETPMLACLDVLVEQDE